MVHQVSVPYSQDVQPNIAPSIGKHNFSIATTYIGSAKDERGDISVPDTMTGSHYQPINTGPGSAGKVWITPPFMGTSGIIDTNPGAEMVGAHWTGTGSSGSGGQGVANGVMMGPSAFTSGGGGLGTADGVMMGPSNYQTFYSPSTPGPQHGIWPGKVIHNANTNYSVSGRHGGQLAPPGGRGNYPGSVIRNPNETYSVSSSGGPQWGNRIGNVHGPPVSYSVSAGGIGAWTGRQRNAEPTNTPLLGGNNPWHGLGPKSPYHAQVGLNDNRVLVSGYKPNALDFANVPDLITLGVAVLLGVGIGTFMGIAMERQPAQWKLDARAARRSRGIVLGEK